MSALTFASARLGRRPRPGLAAALGVALRAIASRRELVEMDERMLKDIGLTRLDALNEANRAPWDIAPRREA